jgi:tetratricopeptide (TPR) repeat protein
MKKSLIITLLFFGCAGTEKTTTKSVAYQKSGPVKSYQALGDTYSQEGSETDALLKESLARQEGRTLRDFSDEKDPISAIASLCYQGNFKNGFEIADKNYNSFKTNPAYWNQIGTCYLLQKDYKKATIFYNRAKGLNSNYIPAINNIGVVLQAEGEYQKALFSYVRAVDLKSGSKTPRFNMANIYLKFGLLNKACRIFGSLAGASPADIDIINAQANCYLLEGKYAMAVREYQKIGKDNLTEPSFGLNYSIALKLTGKKNEALDVYNDLTKKNLGEMRNYFLKVGDFLNRI